MTQKSSLMIGKHCLPMKSFMRQTQQDKWAKRLNTLMLSGTENFIKVNGQHKELLFGWPSSSLRFSLQHKFLSLLSQFNRHAASYEIIASVRGSRNSSSPSSLSQYLAGLIWFNWRVRTRRSRLWYGLVFGIFLAFHFDISTSTTQVILRKWTKTIRVFPPQLSGE